ncbi:MAG: ribonuclease VapC [Candidatus Bathyarchaeia archaeon]|nr:ribonuclease VapC [Candidatus Bathyarchaeota archaeon]
MEKTVGSRKLVLVLDASAFIYGFNPLSVEEASYTVPAVEAEIIGNEVAYTRFSIALNSGRLKILSPNDNAIKEVKESAKRTGDAHILSETDLQLLALALQLREENTPIIVTDDYSIQNVARYLGIKAVPLATFGIKSIIKWVRYCPACRRKYQESYMGDTCEVCGAKLKRKCLKKISIINHNSGEG